MSDVEPQVFLHPLPARPDRQKDQQEPDTEIDPISEETNIRSKISGSVLEYFASSVSLEAALEYLQNPQNRDTLKTSLNSGLNSKQIDFLGSLIARNWEEYAIKEFELALSFTRALD